MTRRILLTLFFASLFFATLFSQAPKRWTSADIHQAIQKLQVLGSALYVAAHPDDENTRLISYLSNEVKANTTYLSLTRGDGGQNLIGTEIQELLGVIRTQELLAARRIDGGQQTFSRANDFGYSKHPDETLAIWNEEAVLSDVVWAIRKYQPDIIINRFDHNSAGETHGHHTSSAILSHRAFDLAGRRDVYPEQLQWVAPWQPERLYFNTSWWFYGSQEAFDQADKSNMLSMDVGVYYPVLGKSNTEIAAESRSMHKCQGMGNTLSRGTQLEYLEVLKGPKPTDPHDPFAGINTTWTRLAGGAPIGERIAKIDREFRYEKPGASVPALLDVCRMIEQLPDGHWKQVKLAEVKEVIGACLALYLEAVADDYSATPGQSVQLSLEAINRSGVEVSLRSVEYLPAGQDSLLELPLANNASLTWKQTVTIPSDAHHTSPYWLNQPWELGMYTVPDQTLRGLPETPRLLRVRFHLTVAGQPLSLDRDVVYKRTDPVEGETYRPFEVLPPVFVNLEEKVYVYANAAPKPVRVVVKAGRAKAEGTVRLKTPPGWRVEPDSIAFSLALKGQEQVLSFELYPPLEQSEGEIHALAQLPEGAYGQELVLIEYDHIPTQSVLRRSQARAVKLDLHKAGNRVAYIMGAGDEIPASLEQIGYEVSVLSEREINLANLKKYDAVILGVRAYNTVDQLKFAQPELFQYVEEGGTMIVQYNTTWRMQFPADQIAPYPLQLSRDRVTVEDAPVSFLLPGHEVLNHPNKIGPEDFQGWVQERGLYFPDQWDEAHFQAVLSCHDPGETPKDGGLLVAQYGKGYYIYTGYSWFRQLPAGVPGAFRLFTNLISIGKTERP